MGIRDLMSDSAVKKNLPHTGDGGGDNIWNIGGNGRWEKNVNLRPSIFLIILACTLNTDYLIHNVADGFPRGG